MFKEVEQHLDLDRTANNCITDDVLKINILKPDGPEVTFVDLPGLTDADQSPSRNLLNRYLSFSNSIAIPVVAPDLLSLDIVNPVAEFDPGRKKTIAVIKQADSPVSDSEESCLQLLNSQSPVPWHIINARSPKFKAKWVGISRFVTISWLRYRLQEIFQSLLRCQISDFVKDCRQRMATCNDNMSKMGQSHSTPRTNMRTCFKSV